MSHVLMSLHAKCDILGRLFWNNPFRFQYLISNIKHPISHLVVDNGRLTITIMIMIKITIMIMIH